MMKRGIWLAFVLVASCHKGGRGGSGSSDGIKVLEVELPAGAEKDSMARCRDDGSGCEAVGQGEGVSAGSMIKSGRGARAWLSVDAATSLDLGEQSAVVFATNGDVEVHSGSAVIRRLGAGEPAADDKKKSDAEPMRLVFGGRSAEIDPRAGANVTVRARSADEATVSVQKGKLTLRSGGQTTMLLAGETVQLVKGRPPERMASFVSVETRPRVPPNLQIANDTAPVRGLGKMTARVPGQNEVVGGVRLVAHDVHVVVRDGVARTEVEEVFHNDTSRVLEGRYVFPLPTDASISRLALWVNDKPVEGEIVEKKRAAAIFKNIVDDTVRPRDPALLEWVSGGDFSLKIFPLPPKGSRKVRLAYDQVLKESGGRVRYVYPLSAGADRATQIDDFTFHLVATDTRSKVDDVETPRYASAIRGGGEAIDVSYSAKQFVPGDDFVVSYARAADPDAEVSAYVPSWGELRGAGLDGAARGAEGAGYVALRLAADLPLDFSPAHVRRDRAIVIDTSHSQSKETLAGEAKLAEGLVRQMDDDEKFVVLACDSACATFPEAGLAAPNEASISGLSRWLGERAPRGSSDVAGALLDAAHRLAPNGAGQIVYVGDGSPTSGELSADQVAARVRRVLVDRKIDLRLLGMGRALDEIVMPSLALSLGATYEEVMTGDPLSRRIDAIAMALRSPVIKAARFELPGTFAEVYPSRLRNLRLGEQVILVARLSGNEPGEVKLSGELEGRAYTTTKKVRWTEESTRQNPLVPRLWAAARIAEMEGSTDSSAAKNVIDLSKRYHVMSRYTSLLVLENDQMYAEFGIKRTAPPTGGDEHFRDLSGALDGEGEGSKAKGAPGFGTGLGKSMPLNPVAAAPAATAAPEPRRAAKKAFDFDSADTPSSPSPVAPSPAPMRRMDPAKPEAKAPAAEMAPMDEAPAARAAPMAPPPPPSGAGGPSLQIATGDSGLAALDDVGSGAGRLGSSNRRPTVTLGNVQVSGPLPREVVMRIVRQQLGRLRVCYEGGLRGDPNLAGRLVARFTIARDGTVFSPQDLGGFSNSAVTSCAMRAFASMFFPQPDGGPVNVLVTVMFTSTPAIGNPWHPQIVRVEPTATHRPGDEAWTAQGDDVLAKLRSAVDQSPESRKKHEDLVRGLLARGRFEEALGIATKLVGLDPDSARAQELLAFAAVVNDDPARAVAAVDTQAETDPQSVKWHARGARAFEAMGDERRACAHWRSLAILQPQADEPVYQALRCRARVLDDLDAALTDARSFAKPGKLVSELIPQLERGTPPPFEKSTGGPGQFEAELHCTGERCPTLAVVSPIGSVFSPITPADSRSSLQSVAFSGLRDGTYRTVLVGGTPDARGDVQVRAFGATHKFDFSRGGRQTLVATKVTIPEQTYRVVNLPPEGFMIAR
jgi:Ca-activated chloride channel family protein